MTTTLEDRHEGDARTINAVWRLVLCSCCIGIERINQYYCFNFRGESVTCFSIQLLRLISKVSGPAAVLAIHDSADQVHAESKCE